MSLQEFYQDPQSFLGKTAKFTILEWVKGKLVPLTRMGFVTEIDGTAVQLSSEGSTHWYHTTSLKFCNIATL